MPAFDQCMPAFNQCMPAFDQCMPAFDQCTLAFDQYTLGLKHATAIMYVRLLNNSNRAYYNASKHFNINAC